MTVRSAASVWIFEHKYFRVSARARRERNDRRAFEGREDDMGGQGSGRSLVAVRPAICTSSQIVAARQLWPPRGAQHIRDRADSLATGQGGWTQTDACGQKQQQQVILTGSPRRARSMTEWRRDPAPMHNHVPCGAVQQTRPGRQGEEPRLQPVRRERRGEEIGSGQVREDRRSRADVGQVATPKVVSRY